MSISLAKYSPFFSPYSLFEETGCWFLELSHILDFADGILMNYALNLGPLRLQSQNSPHKATLSLEQHKDLSARLFIYSYNLTRYLSFLFFFLFFNVIHPKEHVPSDKAKWWSGASSTSPASLLPQPVCPLPGGSYHCIRRLVISVYTVDGKLIRIDNNFWYKNYPYPSRNTGKKEDQPAMGGGASVMASLYWKKLASASWVC